MKYRGAAIAAIMALSIAYGHPGAAQAQQPTLAFTFTGPGDSAVVDVLCDNQPTAVYAGRYEATINGVESSVFCTDFNHDINSGDSYAANGQYDITQPAATTGLSGSYYKGGLASAMTAGDYAPSGLTTGTSASQRAGEVAWLADNYLGATSITFDGGASGSADFDDNLAGVSLAIWDIVQDGGNGFSAGQIQLTGADAGLYSSLGTYYEDLAAEHENYTSDTAAWIQAPRVGAGPDNHKQDYVTELPQPLTLTTTAANTSATVPEPSPVAAFGFTGLFAVGLMLSAKKRKAVV